MKIAIIGSRGYPYVYSGYETFVSELSVRLIQKGHSVTIYCHKALFKERPAKVNGVRLVYLPAIETKSISQLSHSLLSTLHVLFQKVDVVLYVNSANGPFGIFTKAARKKTAINVDGLEWLRPKWKGLGGKYFYFSSWLSTKVFDVVITDSERMADIYNREFHAPSVTIAYGATPAYSTSPQLIEQLGLQKNGYYLIVGRLIPDNNADIIVKGFEQSTTKRKLVVVGDVPYKDQYAQSIKQTTDKRIIFPGYVKDPHLLQELYCNSYAYFHGHEFGGTNPTLLSALAYGCCILAIDTVFSREVLLDEQHGLYFKKEPDAVTQLINLVDQQNELTELYRKKSRERIVGHYTWEKIAAQYENLFLKMLHEH
jgi:glycosyltransferase involved in cell wall biosynthesis